MNNHIYSFKYSLTSLMRLSSLPYILTNLIRSSWPTDVRKWIVKNCLNWTLLSFAKHSELSVRKLGPIQMRSLMKPIFTENWFLPVNILLNWFKMGIYLFETSILCERTIYKHFYLKIYNQFIKWRQFLSYIFLLFSFVIWNQINQM